MTESLGRGLAQVSEDTKTFQVGYISLLFTFQTLRYHHMISDISPTSR